ncbi:MAG: hypothetical protein R3D67_01985 [Hyphomicrobiaceae bacterium]
MQRELNLGSYRAAWFLACPSHPARPYALTTTSGPELAAKARRRSSDGSNFVGGKKKNVHRGKPEPKHAVHALVERGGEARVKHVPDVSAKTLRKAHPEARRSKSTMNTDEARPYYHMKKGVCGARCRQPQCWRYVSKDGKVHISLPDPPPS